VRCGNAPDSTDVASAHERAHGIIDLELAGMRTIAILKVVATVDSWHAEKEPLVTVVVPPGIS
jgi:hypothetical protein